MPESMGGMMDSSGGRQGGGSETEMMYGDDAMGGGMGMEGYGMGMGMGMYGGASGGSALQSGMGGVGFPATPFVTTVVTVHVKKSTIDEFAQGKIDFKQFREAVQVFKY